MIHRTFNPRQLATPIALLLLGFSACSTADSSRISAQERSNLIEQLQDARETDLKDAMDTSLGPLAAGDYMMQAGKAEKAIGDLNGHSNVPLSEISDALFVPPKHLSSAQRVELIKQLEQAKALDDEIWRNHLGGWDPTLTEDCTVQEMRVDRVTKNLETNTPVSWAAIDDAMYVPNEAAW